MRYQIQRFERRFLLGGILALMPILWHIMIVVIPAAHNLNTTSVDTTAITEWIGFTQHLKYVYIYYLALPFVCSLGVNQTTVEDYRSGFIAHFVFHRSVSRYWASSQIMSFLSGFLIAAVPIAIDLLATFISLPALTPDWMINQLITLPKLTYFSTLYYEHPFLLIFIYIGMSGVLGGLAAMVSSTVGLFTKRSIVAISSPLIICLGMAFLTTLSPRYFFDPTTVTIAFSPDYLPPIERLVQVTIGVVVMVWLLGIWRIRKIAKL
ncbi:hypothetical protein [Levilactobacillus tujiorum]|uniref:ABC transporter permease n=1 Tax=Levilactobacillus tujiorum TaxID=2912243 RepID=A0ABX1L9L3_9LACO|nr:hypothetical protein [Levilactobacillus tujiorum]MCH5465532.1 hypothetical protein [Levilactobacillus tujiorum]NLR12732.1 hypothetical protein [Lactobacillus sp. HBUAS51387]NLR30647.1 hypothetical protein [Levilactobacillus tujiorum]